MSASVIIMLSFQITFSDGDGFNGMMLTNRFVYSRVAFVPCSGTATTNKV